jgi:antitoxin VapB
MITTRIFKNGNSQAIRIPSELAYGSWDMEFIIEREGEELRIRPAPRRMGDVLAKLARFSPDFMAEGRGDNEQAERDAL